jgi:hypothetical protein
VVRERLRVAAMARAIVGATDASSAGEIIPSLSASDATRGGESAVPG